MKPTERDPIADIAAAMRTRAHPTVSVWNRLESRPRTTEFGRTLRAEVRDPLWMLTRQWQMGEFRGEDAGSPVTATYHLATTQPTRYRPGGGAPEPVPADLPLEALAERRAVPFAVGADPTSFDLRLVLGRRWLRLLHRHPPLRHLREEYLARYPIALPDPVRDADTPLVAHAEVWATMQAVAGRRMDGYPLYRHVKAGGHAHDGIPNVPPSHRDDLDELGQRLVAWFDDLISQPAGDAAWDPRRLEHRFTVAAPQATAGQEKVLSAEEYPGGLLDWYSFSHDPAAGPLGATGTTGAVTRTVFPAPVRYSGMPHPRWWAFEDGQTNFAAVSPDSTDLARLVFLEFALVYSNDWYLLPCDLPAGTLATVRGLVVTDVFGQRQWITPAGAGDDDDWQRWSMYTMDVAGDAGPTNPVVAADTSLFLPASLPKVAEGPPLEDVLFVRDENANLVWAIERTVTLATGDPRPGGEAAAESVAHRQRLLPPPSAPQPPTAPVAYQIMNTVPENWIPFIPVHVPGDNREIQLQRAALPRVLAGGPAQPVKVRPRTSLLREGLDTQPARSYFVNEEEVPRAGTQIRLAYNRTRWRDGRVVLWLSAHRATGRGGGSSGLAFDRLVDTPDA